MGEAPAKLNNGHPRQPEARAPAQPLPDGLPHALAHLNLPQHALVLVGSGLVHVVALLIMSQVVFLAKWDKPEHTYVVDLRDVAPGTDIATQLSTLIPEEQFSPEPDQPTAEDEPDVQPTDTAAQPAIVEVRKQDQPQKTPGNPNAAVPGPDTGGSAVLGMGASGTGTGLGTGLGYRDPKRHVEGLRKYHGTPESESSVHAALDWLMRHQNSDGHWSCSRFTQECSRGGSCGGTGGMTDVDPGLSALALLAFLSGGNYPGDGLEFGNCISRGVNYLLSIQHSSGRIGPPCSREIYNHSIGTLVLAEAYMLSKDESIKAPMEKAVKYLIDAQQDGGGWDYTPARTGRNDTSITGFAVMALKSAHAAGVDIPWMVTWGLIEHFDRMTRDSGDVLYADQGVGVGRMGQAMVAVAAVSRQFLGWPLQSDVLTRQYELMLANLPRWEILYENSFHTTYYWYYGTLALFQCGGDNWETWNSDLRDMLVRHQRPDGCARGSWDPVEKWLGKAAGRIYVTAMNAMNLQIYYRYLPLYEQASTLNAMEALLNAAAAQGEMRLTALRVLKEFQGPVSHNLLTKALQDPDAFMRLNAARSLLSQGDVAAARPVLEELSRNPNGFVRSGAVEALTRLDLVDLVPVFIERLSDEQNFVAAKAAEKLQRLCRVTFPFDFTADGRATAIAAWTDWWVRYRAGQVTIDTTVIMGKVISAKKSEVMLDVGSRDAVRLNDDFEVIRSGKVIARATVHKVLKTLSAARVQGMSDATGTQDVADVKEGDLVQHRKRL